MISVIKKAIDAADVTNSLDRSISACRTESIVNKHIRRGIVLLSLTLPLTVGAGTMAHAETGATSQSGAQSSTTVATTVSSKLNTVTENPADTATINLLKDYINGSATQSETKSPAENFKITIERYGLWNVGEDGNGQAKYTKDTMPTFTAASAAGGEGGSQGGDGGAGTTTGGGAVATASTEGGDSESSGDGAGSGDTSAASTSGVFTIQAPAGAAGSTTKSYVSLTVPTYEAVGDYWYKVTETDNNVAGVLYGTNDNQTEDTKAANGTHDGVYYIHVQVTNAETKGQYIRTVTLHKAAPDVTTTTTNDAYENWYKNNHQNSEGQNDKKVNDIQNKYYAGTLKIEKKVTGNAGDKNELFKVTVKFNNVTNASMFSDITYKNFYNASGSQTVTPTRINWIDTVTASSHTTQTKSVEFYIKDGTTVEFDNIPYGVQYEITETQPEDDKYVHNFTYGTVAVTADGGTTDVSTKDNAGTFNGVGYQADTVSEEGDNTGSGSWNNAKVTGSISDDLDHVIIENVKESTIDIGVVTEDAPYVAILLMAGVVTFLYLRRGRYSLEE